ncbi:argininosuccinate synthase [Dethiosulfovibrio salsuginis]|uniref:Argininosuccinate synthase n=1 Tax=Dethiosulfovibrio salsuginis TaxID=561720 RepID=A0A1X7L616_9BACT|nr:argininosuccinate synthase [Dethiosulfovibrio salsuginis]SMG48549.1 argininosuccinate synthase [Dethiosulfovibrio salsuginis]
MEKKGKIVLAYSGGLDTSVAVCWLMEKGYDVVTLTADVGQSVNLEEKKAKALKTGAVAAYVMDLKKQFVQEYVWPALKANGMYQGTYPLSSALSRPLISEHLAWVAKNEGAVAVAHGCTGKGQDQVRFEVAIGALNPELEVVAPVRDWRFSREAEIEYAKEHDIEVGASIESPYSIDENLWGRAIECGALEDPWNECPEDAFEVSVSQEAAPNVAENVEITFEKGIPVALNGEQMDGVSLILKLRSIAGAHGVGRIDMLEDRLVGFKSREVYECPAAITLIAAHRALETMTLAKDVLATKKQLEVQFAELTYTGYWFSPLKEAIDAFIDKTQETVSGTVRVKLFKGMATVTGIKSAKSVYNHDLATYSEEDAFDHGAAVGFIKVWGLPLKTWKQTHKQDQEKAHSLSVSC